MHHRRIRRQQRPGQNRCSRKRCRLRRVSFANRVVVAISKAKTGPLRVVNETWSFPIEWFGPALNMPFATMIPVRVAEIKRDSPFPLPWRLSPEPLCGPTRTAGNEWSRSREKGSDPHLPKRPLPSCASCEGLLCHRAAPAALHSPGALAAFRALF
jgi:hypothetical protein